MRAPCYARCSTRSVPIISCFFFNDTATTEIYTLSLHDALPISSSGSPGPSGSLIWPRSTTERMSAIVISMALMRRSEEHTSELQSHHDLVCRLLLEKKKNNKKTNTQQRNRY